MKTWLKLLRAKFILLLGVVVTMSACRGAPCSNCGACGTNYGAPQSYAQTWQTVPSQPVMTPGNTIQPGFYQPGTVPLQPTQQVPAGTGFGG
jgi:hypothetical protein